jgi:hypothetical protein
VGTYSSAAKARRAAAAFVATKPTEPSPTAPRAERPGNWVRCRSHAHRSSYRHVRQVKGRAYQARVWLGAKVGGGSVNLGLFTSHEHGEHREWAAARAAKEFRRLYRPHEPGHGLRETIERLKTIDFIPDSVLPPRVVQKQDGSYHAEAKRGGELLRTTCYRDPWDAHAAMMRILTVRFVTLLDFVRPPRKVKPVRSSPSSHTPGRAIPVAGSCG